MEKWSTQFGGAPPAVTPDASPSAGVSPQEARADHQHGIVTYSGAMVANSGSGGPGTSGAAPARGDHFHPATTIAMVTLSKWGTD